MRPIKGWGSTEEKKDAQELQPGIIHELEESEKSFGKNFLRKPMAADSKKINREILRSIKKCNVLPGDIRVIFPMPDQWTQFKNHGKEKYSDRLFFSVFCTTQEEVVACCIAWSRYPTNALGEQMNGISLAVLYDDLCVSGYCLTGLGNNPGWLVLSIALSGFLSRGQWMASLRELSKQIRIITKGLVKRKGMTEEEYKDFLKLVNRYGAREEADINYLQNNLSDTDSPDPV